jgi:hypothetical protein
VQSADNIFAGAGSLKISVLRRQVPAKAPFQVRLPQRDADDFPLESGLSPLGETDHSRHVFR